MDTVSNNIANIEKQSLSRVINPKEQNSTEIHSQGESKKCEQRDLAYNKAFLKNLILNKYLLDKKFLYAI